MPKKDNTDPMTPQEMNEAGGKPSEPEQEIKEEAAGPNAAAGSDVEIKPVEYEHFEPQDRPAGENKNLDLILDVDLDITVELGRSKMPIRDILNLLPGSVVELNKLSGEPVDILVNGKLMAKGEVVVVDDNFGVKVTTISSQVERIKNLQS